MLIVYRGVTRGMFYSVNLLPLPVSGKKRMMSNQRREGKSLQPLSFHSKVTAWIISLKRGEAIPPTSIKRTKNADIPLRNMESQAGNEREWFMNKLHLQGRGLKLFSAAPQPTMPTSSFLVIILPTLIFYTCNEIVSPWPSPSRGKDMGPTEGFFKPKRGSFVWAKEGRDLVSRSANSPEGNRVRNTVFKANICNTQSGAYEYSLWPRPRRMCVAARGA